MSEKLCYINKNLYMYSQMNEVGKNTAKHIYFSFATISQIEHDFLS